MLSRTRKQIRNIQSFYKEAGLDDQYQSIYEKNCAAEALSKKNRLMIKKKVKQDNESKLQVKTTSDKLNSDASQDLQKQSSNSFTIPSILDKPKLQSTLPLAKMITKISILQVSEAKTITGCYGHTTVIFKRPIIEGRYYLEFKMNKAVLGENKAKIKSEPAVRVGICSPDYSKNAPLGADCSIAYKGSNGRIVSKSIQQPGGQAVREGDVLGLGICFSPPYKYLDEKQLWEQSYVVITKNGKVVAKYQKIYQKFYCPALSLYNYANVEVRTEESQLEFPIIGFKPYANIFDEPIEYEQLKSSSQFAYLKIEDGK